MHRFKKNLGFNLGLIVLGAAFLAGLVMAFLAYTGGEETSRALRTSTITETGLLNGHAFAPGEAPVSLNEDNVKAAQADVADLAAHRDKLSALIAGNAEMAGKTHTLFPYGFPPDEEAGVLNRLRHLEAAQLV